MRVRELIRGQSRSDNKMNKIKSLLIIQKITEEIAFHQFRLIEIIQNNKDSRSIKIFICNQKILKNRE